MTFEELIEEVKKESFEELRSQSDTGLEFVIRTEKLSQLNPTLERFFGPATKPAGVRPRGEEDALASNFGGILKNQTLYSIAQNGVSHLAMIWPWGDGENVTVKIFKIGPP